MAKTGLSLVRSNRFDSMSMLDKRERQKLIVKLLRGDLEPAALAKPKDELIPRDFTREDVEAVAPWKAKPAVEQRRRQMQAEIDRVLENVRNRWFDPSD